MGYPDLIHLMKSPHWWVWILAETGLIMAAIMVGRFAPSISEVLSPLLILIAILLYSFLSLGVALSNTVREVMVRPEAIVERRHWWFLVIGGVFGLLWAMLLVAYVLKTTVWA
jgi:hypothetical protein